MCEWFRLRRGSPPEEGKRYKTCFLKLILTSTTKVLVKSVALRMIPNGDFREQRVVLVFVPFGVEVDEDKLRELVADALEELMCGTAFRQYNGDKWMGQEEAYDDYIRNNGIHGIGAEAYKRTVHLVMARKKDAKPSVSTPSGSVNAPTPQR